MNDYLPAQVLRGAALFHLFAFAVAAAAMLWIRLAGTGQVRYPRLAAAANHRWLVRGVYLLAGNAFILVSRLPSIHYDSIFNPDEAQMTAHAMQVCRGAFGWGGMDGGSAGPLLSIILAWPCLFGGEVSMLTSRLTAALIVCAIATIVFLACAWISDVESAIVATFPLFVFYGAAINVDFIHYSTELLPILLMVASTAVFFRLDPNAPLSGRRLVEVGAAFASLGLLPLAKLQAMPIGFVIGLALLIRIAVMARNGWVSPRTALVTVLVTAMPSAFALLATIFQGDFRHFLNSYVLWAADYLRTPLGMPEFFQLVAGYSLFRTSFACLMGMLAFVLIARCVSPVGLHPGARGAALLGLAALLAVYVATVTSGRKFFHYLHYTLPFIALAVAATLSGSRQPAPFSGRIRRYTYAGGFVALLAVLGPMAKNEILGNPSWSRDGAFLVTPAQAGSRLMSWLRPTRGDSLVIWGWMPHWYFRLGLPPGTREVTSRNQIVESSQRPYFRSRWLEDFRRNRPDFVIDPVVPGSFAFQNPKTQSISSFPEFAQVIRDEFVDISGLRAPADCAKTFVRRTRWEALGNSLLNVNAIVPDDELIENGVRFTAAALDDRSVLEGCNDYWLLPERKRGGVTMRLEGDEPVAEVALLNTRGGGRGDRGAKTVRITLVRNGQRVGETVIAPEPFPIWTSYRLSPAVAATEIRIDIVEFHGRGGGLNEVKIYRSAP